MALRIYKSGQGRYVRVGTAVGATLVDLAVCYVVWAVLSRALEGVANRSYMEYPIPAALFVVLAAVVFVAMNRPKVVDFFIATESEMKKVSWSSKAELFGSTMVVIVVVILLAAFIFMCDAVVTWMFDDVVGLW